MRLKLKKGKRLSPQIEKCCLLLVGNESFINAERDLEILTGIKVPHSTQHRLVNSYQLPKPKIINRAESLSVDGGTVRLRTPLGKQSEWKNYKAVKIHDRMGMAFFQDNERLRQAKNYLWQGFVDEAIALFDDLKKKQARNFQNYLRKHRQRIPDYQLDKQLGICIGSGSVESWLKQIASRVKIIGALRES